MVNFIVCARALALLACSACLAVRAAPPALVPQPFVSGLEFPVEIVNANDGSRRLFVLEQVGRARIIKDGVLLPTPFLDFSSFITSGGESGLLGLAFHPQYAANRQFYVFYTRDQGDGGLHLYIAMVRASENPDRADPTILSSMEIRHPVYGNHNGGKLAFGPDGYLYVSLGDGGGGGDPFGAPQNLDDIRGKILRLDVSGGDFQPAPGNPFIDDPSPVRRMVWAYGFRNPWRFTFDRDTGDLFIGDVGEGQREEISFEPAGSGGGRNYGWSVFEGTVCYNPPTGCSLPNHHPPIIDYPRDFSVGGRAVTAGYRYRGGALPALYGYYVYADYLSGNLWAAAPEGPAGAWATTRVAIVPGISAFGEDENGELYITDHQGGRILRLTPDAATIPRLGNISTRAAVGSGENVTIGGFVIEGPHAKTVVVTAKGPSLTSFGVAGALADPRLTLVRQSDSAVVGDNDDWGAAANAAQLQASGLAPSHAAEAAVMATLAPGAYTAIVSGEGGSTGVGLVEVYEVDHPERALLNISARAQVLGGDGVMIGGFVIQGTAPQAVAILARGPSLAAFGIANPLANPTLTVVRQSDGVVVASNDNWGEAANAAEIMTSGFAPTHPSESAVVATLAPGAYTAIVQGVGGGTGVGIVEVYAR